jgi:hypothetical protein
MGGTRFIPVSLLDVAGLIPGAHLGKGLGNQFLDDLRQADVLIHVLDASGLTNEKGEPLESGGHDPEMDIGMLEKEIDWWIRGILEKSLERLERTARAEKIPMEKLLARQLSGLGIREEAIGRALRRFPPASLEFASELRKESKPILVAANKIDLPEARANLERLRKRHEAVPCSAESELALKEAANHGLIEYVPGSSDFTPASGKMSESQEKALQFIRENVLRKFGSTGVQQALNRAVFGLLGMAVVYPVASIGKLADSGGNVLPDAFLVKKGLPLKELAWKIHRDIAENFIGGLNLKKQKIGADYPLQDGDVVEILFRK